jgi:hypothetical protein
MESINYGDLANLLNEGRELQHVQPPFAPVMRPANRSHAANDDVDDWLPVGEDEGG